MTLYDPANDRCSNRLYERMSGLAMVGYGLHVMIAPYTLAHSRYAAILLLFWPAIYGLCCFTVGTLRLISLYKNGAWLVWGPRIRILVSLAALGLYAQIAVALGQWAHAPSSPGVWIYIAFLYAEVETIRRVVREQKNVQRI